MQAILLAAGLGTRLRPYTLLRPKPLFPVLNRPLLLGLLDKLALAGMERVVVNCHYLADQVAAAVEELPQVILQVEPEILGTGGALRLALDRLDQGPLLVMNGDIHHEIDLAAVVRHHKGSGNLVTMVLHDCPRYNSVLVRGDRVTGFSSGAGDGAFAYTGVQIVEPEVIRRIPRGVFHHIIDLYREVSEEGGIGMVEVSVPWRDIGTVADYLGLHRELLEAAPQWVIHPGARIGPGVRLAQWGVLGAGVRIGRETTLQRCVVWPGAVVPGGASLEDALICGDPAIDCGLRGWPGQ